MKPLKLLFVASLLATASVFSTGCSTSDDHDDGDGDDDDRPRRTSTTTTVEERRLVPATTHETQVRHY